MPIGFLIIILLLVLQFNSIRLPIIVLTTIPLGIIGVVIGLLVANSYFGFMTLLGVVSLAGIVVNNAIVLLDRIGYEIKETWAGTGPGRYRSVSTPSKAHPPYDSNDSRRPSSSVVRWRSDVEANGDSDYFWVAFFNSAYSRGRPRSLLDVPQSEIQRI